MENVAHLDSQKGTTFKSKMHETAVSDDLELQLKRVYMHVHSCQICVCIYIVDLANISDCLPEYIQALC